MGANLVGNTVDGTDIGIGIWNSPSDLVSISGGTLRNNLYGIQVDNGRYPLGFSSEYIYGAGTDVNINGVTIVNHLLAALHALDNPANQDPTSTVRLFANGMVITGGPSIATTSGQDAYIAVCNSTFSNVVDTVGTGNVFSDCGNIILVAGNGADDGTGGSSLPGITPQSWIALVIPVHGTEQGRGNIGPNGLVFILYRQNFQDELARVAFPGYAGPADGTITLKGEDSSIAGNLPNGVEYLGPAFTLGINGPGGANLNAFGSTADLRFTLPAGYTVPEGKKLAIMHLDPATGQWVEMPTSSDGVYVHGSTSEPGTYALMLVPIS